MLIHSAKIILLIMDFVVNKRNGSTATGFEEYLLTVVVFVPCVL
ncbi:MAG: hypothetical protein UW22_C0048G0012 [Candidatus Gottesmanbacteria bacterium GW2011_GWB1_44_11c]|uniref:Uncharacterized protein n=1 Tax=Candidatus Gottesmanbacteria bacterium GW2011_GWB1_44_11c TaxID=1618447 RepID=A0A0G1GMN6_9BACT|nr:MAG: hypothetical protein UW22_C0048G0012 [Candidatus Gottesmanbacteria bacterium GW2011_GWB1_44_11c]